MKEVEWKTWEPSEKQIRNYEPFRILLADGVMTRGVRTDKGDYSISEHGYEGGSKSTPIAWDYFPDTKMMKV